MSGPCDPDSSVLRNRLIGLGERSIRKSHYPELQRRLAELERFRALLDSASDAVFLFHLESGKAVDANTAARRRFGDLSGKRLTDILPPAQCRDILEEADRDDPGDLVARGPLLNWQSDPEAVFEVTATPRRFRVGRYAMVVIRDVSKRVAAERARAMAEEDIRRSLREKEALLKEVHHRVKNNLQIIISLISLQSAHASDALSLDMFRVIRDRIMAMGLVHEELYKSESLAEVKLSSYCGKLAARMLAAWNLGGRIAVELDVGDLSLPVNTAIPLGLALNECLTNAFKHAFADGRVGRVRIAMRREGGSFKLRVSDDGPGLPKDFDPGSDATLGVKLITSLAEQLRGRVSFENDFGALVTFVFPEDIAGAGGSVASGG